MQGLVNFTSAIADVIAVLLPAFCYLAACMCFFFWAWTLRSLAYHHYHHPFWQRPWVPWVSLLLCGVFASFPVFLSKLNVSAGTNMAVSLTSYAATVPGNTTNILGATPANTVINVVRVFQYFFQAFGAACVFWALITWRAILSQRIAGSQVACGIQIAFGVMCINILTIATGMMAWFQTANAGG